MITKNTIFDFQEVDLRIYLPKLEIFTEAARPRCIAASVNITFEGRLILMSTEVEVKNCSVV